MKSRSAILKGGCANTILVQDRAMKNMKQRILKLMKGHGYQSLTISELARAIGAQADERSEMRAVINKMERTGEVINGKSSRYQLSEKGNTAKSAKGGKATPEKGKFNKPKVRDARKSNRGSSQSMKGYMSGTIRFQHQGHAWFYPDPNDQKNIEAGFDIEKYDRVYIDGRDTEVALDGDKVRVHVKEPKTEVEQSEGKHYKGKKGKKGGKFKGKKKSSNKPWEKGPSGKVLEIIERVNNTVLGIYRSKGKFKYVEPDFSGFPKNLELEAGDDGISGGAKSGQTVVVELIRWDNKFTPPVGKIKEVLGWPEDPGVDIVSVIHKYSLRQGFPGEVLQAAENISETIPKEEYARREDWRDELVVTVDPADAKDYDDAIIVKPQPDGGWELAVHIADVSHYVKPGSELDIEAKQRGNSTYLVDRVLPMLPEKISNNVCSLRGNVDRLTKCAVMNFDSKGNRMSARFCDAVIHSKARMSYEEAQVMLQDENADSAIAKGLKSTWALATVLRKKRFADGALDLEFPEVKVVLDDKLKAIGVENVIHNESHQMVEECMLAANEAVAVELKMKRKNAIYRIHEDPDADKLNEFAENARAQGYQVGDLTNQKHIQDLFDAVKGNPDEESIKIGLLKSLKRAAYSVEGLGHYGLAKMDYCHFTSPIRRYADLIVHRAMQGLLQNPPEKVDGNPKLAEMREVADHISTTERKSAEAEIATKKMKMMEYLSRLARDGKSDVFEALVTDVRRMGLFVEISSMRIKGLVKIEDLPGREYGSWRMDGMRFVNSDGTEIGLGAKVKVEIKKIDTERNMVDFRVTEF